MKSAFYKSLALHLIALLLITVDFPWMWHRDMVLDQVPIIVDLEQVKISEVTNLPAKAKFADEDRAAGRSKPTPPPPPKPQPKPEPKPVPEPQVIENTPEAKPAPAEEKPQPIKESFMVPPQPSKPKPEKKPEPKKVTPPPAPAKPKPQPQKAKPAPKAEKPKAQAVDNPLKNLLDSVNAMEKNIGADNSATIKTGTKVANMGIEGGTGGSYFSELSISETDAIASRLRQCWNLDSGAMGIEDMIVEIRAYLGKDGSVQKVDILNTSRYNSDSHFRSVADSAKRAVYICAPYSILAQKYGDKYDLWKTMLLRFNPINHTVN